MEPEPEPEPEPEVVPRRQSGLVLVLWTLFSVAMAMTIVRGME
jgi:hypothetical protein